MRSYPIPPRPGPSLRRTACSARGDLPDSQAHRGDRPAGEPDTPEGLVPDSDVEIPLAETEECLTSVFTTVSSIRVALEEIDRTLDTGTLLGGHAA